MPKVQRSTDVDGNYVTVGQPKFLSLVKKPANQRAFSILRSEEEGKQMSNTRIRRTRRSDDSNLVRLTFAASMAEADVKGALETFGLSGMSLTRADDASEWVASNAIDCKEEDLEKIILNQTTTAYVKRSESTTATEAKTQLDIVEYRFDEKVFDEASATEWLQRNSVDVGDKHLNNSAGAIVLQRKEIAEGEETRQMELEDGVLAVLVRSCECGVPEGYIAVVNEMAYSGWGWGQLDFDAHLADVQVGDKLREGLYFMEDVLRNILFHSQAPVDVRKELVMRALGQYGVYVANLLDSLPRQLMMSIAAVQRNEEETEMSKSTGAEGATQDGQALTREDLANVVRDVLRAEREAEKEKEAEELRRSEEAKQKEAADKEAADLRRSEITEAVTAALAPVAERLEKLENTTIVRSDSGDNVQKPNKPAERKDIWRGAIPGIRHTTVADQAEE